MHQTPQHHMVMLQLVHTSQVYLFLSVQQGFGPAAALSFLIEIDSGTSSPANTPVNWLYTSLSLLFDLVSWHWLFCGLSPNCPPILSIYQAVNTITKCMQCDIFLAYAVHNVVLHFLCWEENKVSSKTHTCRPQTVLNLYRSLPLSVH